MRKDIGRNDPCPCGSGKKYKQCCLQKDTAGPAGLRGRKFTAKVLSAKPGAEEVEKKVISVDYNQLMEKTFGESLRTYEEKPPIPENPSEYLPKD